MEKLIVIVHILAGEKMVEIMEKDISKKFCKRCHRELKDNQSKQIGYGPVCYKKYLDRKKIYLFDLPIISDEKLME